MKAVSDSETVTVEPHLERSFTWKCVHSLIVRFLTSAEIRIRVCTYFPLRATLWCFTLTEE